MSMINDAASLISKLRVNRNDKVIYDGTVLFIVKNIKNLFKMSKQISKDTSGSSQIRTQRLSQISMGKMDYNNPS